MIDGSTLRIALRTLGKHRGFTTVAILSLAVAIALNTTMYSVMDAMLDPRIDARKPENIYAITYYGDYRRQLDAGAMERALEAGVGNYEGVTGGRLFARYNQSPVAENGTRYMRVQPLAVRSNYFDFLGTRPVEGRTFVARDEREERPVAVISDRLAEKLFSSESPVGRTFTLDGEGYTIIGAVRRNTTFGPLFGDVWVLRPSGTPPVGITMVRLRKQIDEHLVADELKVVAARLALAVGESPSQTSFRAKSFATQQFKFKIGKFHAALIGAVAAVLLVACANLANLQLARGLARSRELAMRSAVGASRRQLISLLLLESGILAVAGLLLGIVLTLWGVGFVRTSVPPVMADYMIEPQTSWGMFAAATAAALVCLFLIGLLPALRVSRVDPNALLKSGSGTGANREHRKRYGMMVIAQIGFALPVLCGAIVLLKTAWGLHDDRYLIQRYGYDPGPLVAASVPIQPPMGVGSYRIAGTAAELTSLAKAVPGVVDAAFYLGKDAQGHLVTVDDENGVLREEMAHQWLYRVVSPGYFRTFGRTIVRGRDFREGEFDGRGVIIDEPTARFLWKNANPLGRSIKLGNAKSDLPFLRVIGIVGDLRDTNAIRQYDYTANYRLNLVARVIMPSDSIVIRRGRTERERWMLERVGLTIANVTMFARVKGNTELAAIRLQRALRSVSAKEKPSVTPLEDDLGVSYERTRHDFVASLFGTFAFLGMGLVAIGVYGIVSHSIEERRRELAVRISLGATTRDILRSVLREGNALILAGIAIGLLFTKYTVWWIMAFMNENDGYNAPLFAVIAAGLFAIAVVSAFRPAWRATRIDPVEALRHE